MADSGKALGLDEAALERLYAALERPLYNVVLRWVWQAEDAQEIVQEAFVRLWRMRDRVDLAHVEALVYRIALNLASNKRRARRLWQWLSLDFAGERQALDPSPPQLLEARQREAALRRAVEALPERLRQVVMLCELGQRSYSEVAEILGIPEGTVASRRHAALEKLAQHLTAQRGG